MSVCYKDTEVCLVCGITYKQFRCSIQTFQEARNLLYTGIEDPIKWRYKRRRSVLGIWHAMKKMEWEYHLQECSCLYTGKYDDTKNADCY